MAREATATTLAFSAPSSKIFRGPDVEVCHELPFLTRRIGRRYAGRQGPCQEGMDLDLRGLALVENARSANRNRIQNAAR
jgi:hypothetical protein